jgi:hypothetical protein
MGDLAAFAGRMAALAMDPLAWLFVAVAAAIASRVQLWGAVVAVIAVALVMETIVAHNVAQWLGLQIWGDRLFARLVTYSIPILGVWALFEWRRRSAKPPP